MEYPVIIEQKNGVWRAVIPALSDLTAEGASRDEAVLRARLAAEEYLSSVEVTTIRLSAPQPQPVSPRSPREWINSAGKFAGDEEAMQEHIEEIYAERRRQREQAEREESPSAAE